MADEMGLGKTVQAICGINELKAKKALVLCPAVVKLNWKRELEIWLNEKLNIQILNGRNDTVKANTDIVIVNYDLIVSPSILAQLIRLRFAVGIFDESHYLKNRQAKRTKAVLYKAGIASRCVYKWFLTGTPILNRPIELYPILKACVPNLIAPFNSYDAYAKRFCDAWWDGFQLVAKGASNLDDLSRRLNSGFMLRRLKKDVLKELPDKQYQLVMIPAKDKKIQELLKREFTFAPKELGKAAKVGVDGAELAIIRHQLALSKVETAIEHIEDLLEEQEKIVVFAYHKDVIAIIAEKLGQYGVVCITGDTAQNKRQSIVDAFQGSKECRVFIGQIDAAGVGITLTAASNVVFVESSWVPGVIDQAVDRCHRIGQKDAVNAQFLVIQDSLEEYMLKTVIEKKQVIEQVMTDKDNVGYLFT